jgi:hypothetical protein
MQHVGWEIAGVVGVSMVGCIIFESFGTPLLGLVGAS